VTHIYYQVINSTSLGSTKMVNVMHFEKVTGGAATVSDVNALLLKFKQEFYNALAAYFPAAAQWRVGDAVYAKDLDDLTANTFVPATASTSLTGTGTSLPGQLAACVRWITPLHTRQGRGRTFFGPLCTSALSGQALSTTAIAAINAAAATAVGSGTGIGSLSPAWQMVVHSKVGNVNSIVTTGNTDGVVDTLRSRKY
jgi:hypothetical protein